MSLTKAALGPDCTVAICRRSICVEGGSSSDALRDGAGAGIVGNAVGMMDVALLGGVVGWHRSMIGGAAGDGLGGVVGGELSWSGGAGSPVGGGHVLLTEFDEWRLCM